jgi:hypothetical protein
MALTLMNSHQSAHQSESFFYYKIGLKGVASPYEKVAHLLNDPILHGGLENADLFPMSEPLIVVYSYS